MSNVTRLPIPADWVVVELHPRSEDGYPDYVLADNLTRLEAEELASHIGGNVAACHESEVTR
jgi:hypothetical protein